MEHQLTISLIIVFAVISVIPLFAKSLRLPVIVTEIIFGIIIGKSFFNIIPEHPLIDFFSTFGLAYLLFLAGIEVRFDSIKKYATKTVLIASASVIIPFFSGFILGPHVDIHPLLLGTIFSTSSLGLVLPLTKGHRFTEQFLNISLTSIIIAEIFSIFLLAFTLSYITGSPRGEFLYSLLAILLMFVVPWMITHWHLRDKVIRIFSRRLSFDIGVRIAFALILILGTISDILGFHTIIGAFIAGLIISQITPNASLLEEKLESFGYGFFIPLFFVFVGAKVNITEVFSTPENISTLIVIILIGILANVVGVAITAKINRLPTYSSLAMGFLHASLLSLTIAAAEITIKAELITTQQFSIFVLLAITSAIVSPTFGKYFLIRQERQKEKEMIK